MTPGIFISYILSVMTIINMKFFLIFIITFMFCSSQITCVSNNDEDIKNLLTKGNKGTISENIYFKRVVENVRRKRKTDCVPRFKLEGEKVDSAKTDKLAMVCGSGFVWDRNSCQRVESAVNKKTIGRSEFFIGDKSKCPPGEIFVRGECRKMIVIDK